MDVRDLTGKLGLVTGAASGIGRETALALGRRGADLVVCDVDQGGLGDVQNALEKLGRRVLARKVDVSSEEEMRAFAAAVHAEHAAVDLLVNNAGVGLGASFLETTLEDWKWILDINVVGVVHGCHFFLPPMVERGRGGHVVNIASAAAFVATEQLAAYSATKFAVRGLSESLRAELAPHGIGVTTVCPGIIDTPITRASRMRGWGATPEARERVVEAYRKRGYTPDRVARNILKAVARNRAVAPISIEAWTMYWMKRFIPRTTALVSRKLGERAKREAEAAARAAGLREKP